MRLSVAIAVACLSLTALSTASEVEAAIRKSTNIPAQGLGPALQILAQQRDFQVVYLSDAVDRLRTSGAVGELTTEEALIRLLNGTGLAHRYVDEKTVTVFPIATGSSLPSRRERSAAGEDFLKDGNGNSSHQGIGKSGDGTARREKESFWNRFRLAQAETSSQERTAEEQNTSSGNGQKRIELEEVVVTGSRLRRSEQDGAAPVVIFDRARIDELGITTVPELLRYLPQQPYMQAEEKMTGAGGRYVDLRGLGLGSGSTAVLINGRPAAVSGSSGSFNAVDLNSIPLAAIERIEVLSSSASAVYGANAMAGVINIVLKENIERPVVELRYGAAEGGAKERRASFSSGLSHGRFSGSLTLDYHDRSALFGAQRDRWANQDYRRFGGLDRRSTSTNPGNVSSRTASNLPGLPSTVAAVPAGSTGVGLTPEDFLATAGEQNRDSLYRYYSLLGEHEQSTGLANGEFDLTPATTLFGQLMYEKSRSTDHSPPTAATLTVPATNPFNPFGEAVSVSYLFTGVGPRYQIYDKESTRALLGVKGDLKSWDWELSVAGTKGEGIQRAFRTVDMARVNAALASTDPSLTLNVFTDGQGDRVALSSLVVPPQHQKDYSSEDIHSSAQLRGALATLPAGPLQVVLGASSAREETEYHGPIDVTGDRTSSAVFSELGIPLVSSAMRIRGVAGLQLTAAVRYDRYSDFGDTVNPQYGLVWTPISDLSLRVSRGTSFSPPSLFNLLAPRLDVPFGVTDPRRNNENVQIALITGGNPDLLPVEGESLTAGFVLTPSRIAGLRVSMSYWEIETNNQMTVIPPQQMLDNEALFSGRIVRGQPTPAEAAAGLPGPVTSVDVRRVNFGHLQTSGIDWDVSYSLETRWGRFVPSVLGTWTARYTAVEFPGTPAVQRLGVADNNGSIPRWKVTAALSWVRSGFGCSATARYIHGYEDATIAGGPTGRHLPAQTLVDMQASINLGEVTGGHSRWLRDLKITAGVSNLFDHDPPFSEIFSSSGYDGTQADLIGRSGYITVTRAF